mmetsp:Transcript_42884/g.130486  ORF Transcript_42884/g.130486 Transcript_42884/m.130486 type:complete len:102 (-) Transcript_42884:12-317(-)
MDPWRSSDHILLSKLMLSLNFSIIGSVPPLNLPPAPKSPPLAPLTSLLSDITSLSRLHRISLNPRCYRSLDPCKSESQHHNAAFEHVTGQAGGQQQQQQQQ